MSEFFAVRAYHSLRADVHDGPRAELKRQASRTAVRAL